MEGVESADSIECACSEEEALCSEEGGKPRRKKMQSGAALSGCSALNKSHTFWDLNIIIHVPPY